MGIFTITNHRRPIVSHLLYHIRIYVNHFTHVLSHIHQNIVVEGAVASWLESSTPGGVVRVRVVFLGKTLYSHGASLHPGV